MPKLRRMSRSKRKELVAMVVAGSDEPMRLTEIARAMNLTRSPYLRTIMDELVEEGRLVMEWEQVGPDIDAKMYSAASAPRVLRSDPTPLTD